MVGALTAIGLATAAFVFIGVPMAAQPLARWTPPGLEARFGANMEVQLSVRFRPCKGDPRAAAVLSKLGETLASGADTAFPIRVKAVRAPFVNAFALPGGFADQRFSRALETESHVRAIQLLARHQISTQVMADFFGRMADRKSDPKLRKAAEWFATHPDTGERADRASRAARPGRPALSQTDWALVKGVCRALRSTARALTKPTP